MNFLSGMAPRPELLHALIVHFPFALWLTGTLLYLMSLHRRMHWLKFPSVLMGILGSLSGWAAIETGLKALRRVAAQACDMKLLHRHAEQAEIAFTFFWVSWVLIASVHLLRHRFFANRKIPRIFNVLTALGLLLGTAFLILTGSNGQRLVFEQNVATTAGRAGLCAR